jgi:hypothetical protein
VSTSTRILSLKPIAVVGDPLSRHIRLVEAVRGHLPPPPQWDELVARLEDFRLGGGNPMRDRLIDVLLHGGPDQDRIGELRALAEAEAIPTNPTLMAAVQGSVAVELRDLFEPVAGDAYRSVAKTFDDAATRFAAAADKVDVEADSEAVVALPAGARTAWIDAFGFAQSCDELLVLLVAAAELNGVVIDLDESLIPMIVANTDELHRRRLWEAFGSANPDVPQRSWVSKREIANVWSPPRCGRWSALVAVGAEIRAADLDEPIQPYHRPPPLDRRQRRETGHVGEVPYVFDPCDDDYQEQLEAAGFPPKHGAAYAAAAH